jgi:hypothetical protein
VSILTPILEIKRLRLEELGTLHHPGMNSEVSTGAFFNQRIGYDLENDLHWKGGASSQLQAAMDSPLSACLVQALQVRLSQALVCRSSSVASGTS